MDIAKLSEIEILTDTSIEILSMTDREYLSEEDITELYVLCDKLLEVEGSENVQNKKNYYIDYISKNISGYISFIKNDKMLILLSECYGIKVKEEAIQEFNEYIKKMYNESSTYETFLAFVNCLSILNINNEDNFINYLSRYKKEINQIKSFIEDKLRITGPEDRITGPEDRITENISSL